MKKTLAIVSIFLFFGGLFLSSGEAANTSLKVEVSTDQNVVEVGTMILVTTHVANPLREEIRFWANDCSYDKHWVTDNPDVMVQPWTCDENELELITLKQDQIYEKSILIYVYKKDATGDMSFRLGFKCMNEDGDVTEPLWSNPLHLQVRVPNSEDPEAETAAKKKQSSEGQSSSTPSVPLKTFQDPEVPIQVVLGEEFLITAPRNASTGFSWEVEIQDPKKTVELVESQYEPAPESRPGVPGHQICRFKARKTGETKIHFTYRRLWEQKHSEKHKIFTVTVKEN